MNRKSLGILAIVIIILMAIVATAGLDSLPPGLKNSVAAASTRVSTDRTLFERQRAEIDEALREEPALFRSQAAAWRTRLAGAQARLSSAEGELSELKKLAGNDRREDRGKVEQGLSRLETLRAGALQEVQQISSDAKRWLQFKRDLPAQLEKMKANHEAVQAFDVQGATAGAQKAMVDWPAKRSDLETRVAALNELKSRAEQAWSSSADLRAQAEGAKSDSIDYPALFREADQLEAARRGVQQGAEAVNQLAGQLYVNWDKLLVDVEDDRQKVRVVQTRYPDATLQNGQTSQEEKWEPIGRVRSESASRNVGMVVARKPAGKYESEQETVPQPPGYAYVAPPGQSNSYGSWNNGVWSWLPQYLILSQLLRGPSIPPIGMGDYGSYQSARRRGEVFYGYNNRSYGSALRRSIERMRSGSSSGGGFWKEREQPRASGSSGYRGSQYQTRGSYSGSRYQSRPGGFRSFRRGGRR